MANVIGKAIGLCVFTSSAAILCAQTVDPSVQYAALQQRTSLTQKGKSPFHIKLDVQLFDVEGKPSGTGSVEEWWMSPKQYRIEYTSGVEHTVDATGSADQTITGLSRNSFLLHKALQELSAPVQSLQKGEVVRSDPRTVAGTKFDCLKVEGAPAPGGEFYACQTAGTVALRVSGRAFETVVRDRIGMFHETEVSLLFSLSYGTRPALTAKISALAALRADTPDVPKLIEDKNSSPGPERTRLGKIISKSAPEYPLSARLQHLSGTVVLGAIVTKAGVVSNLVGVASPDASLTGAALDAVRRWRYEPALVNGQPTEIETTIVVNFHINGQ